MYKSQPSKKTENIPTKTFDSFKPLCVQPIFCKYNNPFNISLSIPVKCANASMYSWQFLAFSEKLWHDCMRWELHLHISMGCLSHRKTSASEHSHTSINMTMFSSWLWKLSMEIPWHLTMFGWLNFLKTIKYFVEI